MTQSLSLEVEVDRTTPAEWSAMLELFNDASIYQSWAYGQVHWRKGELSHLVLRRQGEVIGMAQLRIVRPVKLHIGVAYLRWGPLWDRRGVSPDPELMQAVAGALEREYVIKRGLFLRILPNAFLGSERAAAFQCAFRNFSLEPLAHYNTYRTSILDLSPGLDELRARLDRRWRNHLSRAERNGLRVTAGTGNSEYRVFCSIYAQMMRRKAFDTSVDVDEFGRIQENLPEAHRMRILLCEDRGEPVAGLVASAMGDRGIYLLGATSDTGLKAQGAYLLQWTLIQWLKDNGYRWYDLGGIDPVRNPGVYAFKYGLSGVDVSHVNPIVACKSPVSSAIVRTGLTMERAVRGWVNALPLPSHT